MNRLWPCLFAFVVAAIPRDGRAQAAPPPPARLAVLLVLDQVASVEVDRLAPLFGPGGFGGLEGAGARRFDLDFAYNCTLTAPGHATLVTGASPRVHGVVGNHWLESLEDGRILGVAAIDDPVSVIEGLDGKPGRSAKRMAAPTLGSALKQHARTAQVVSLSLKDRAALLSGGPDADLTLWYEKGLGRFTGPAAQWRSAVMRWPRLAELVTALPAAGVKAKTEVLPPLPEAGGEAWVQEHGVRPELPAGFGLDLPALHPAVAIGAYRLTARASADLLTLAGEVVDGLGLGADEVPDLLVISISATDYIGHLFGPRSHEYVELMRALDGQLRGFVAQLVGKLGAGKVAVAVTSDHGSPPAPERQPPPLDAGRVTDADLSAAIDEALRARFGDPPTERGWVLGVINHDVWLHLDRATAAQRRAMIEAARAAALRVPGVAAVYSADEPPGDDPYAIAAAACRYPGRHGHLQVRQRPHWLWATTDASAMSMHGSPYEYDRLVPLWLLGPGVGAGRELAPVDARHLAPTLAALLGVAPPAAAEGVSLVAAPAARGAAGKP